MTEAQLRTELKKTKDFFEDNFQALYAAAATPADRDAVRAQYVAAKDAYWTALARGLADSGDFVDSLAKKLRAANTAMANSLTGLGNLAAFLKIAAEAVTLAAAIATLAASA